MGGPAAGVRGAGDGLAAAEAWEEAGVWERVWRAVLGSLDAAGKLAWAQAFIDGSFVPAKRGAPGSG